MSTSFFLAKKYSHDTLNHKPFVKSSCFLCIKEKISILTLFFRENPNLIINSNLEFYSACRHKPKFHRYYTTPHSTTDEK